MDNSITLAGVTLKLKSCKKINIDPITNHVVLEEPMVNIVSSKAVGSDKLGYTVNIAAYIPKKRIALSNSFKSGVFLNDEHTIFFDYAGVKNIKTSINETLLCREFNIIYQSISSENYDLYHIELFYILDSFNCQSVEAAFVCLINKPHKPPVTETPRGTVTAIRTDDRD